MERHLLGDGSSPFVFARLRREASFGRSAKRKVRHAMPREKKKKKLPCWDREVPVVLSSAMSSALGRASGRQNVPCNPLAIYSTSSFSCFVRGKFLTIR